MRKKVYRIEWDQTAIKQFRKIRDQKLSDKILHILENEIARNPFIGKPLNNPFKGVRSYRVGKLRILYKQYKDKLIIVVLNIDHRKDVYR